MQDLLCSRPPAHRIDWTSRFVVAKACGLTIGTRRYEYGEEIPCGALTKDALRQIYEPPLRLIELLTYAREMNDPALREACARRGIALDPPPSVPEAKAGDAPCHGNLAVKVNTQGSSEGGGRSASAAPSQKASVLADLESLTRAELAKLCRANKLDDTGNRKDLLRRLAAMVG